MASIQTKTSTMISVVIAFSLGLIFSPSPAASSSELVQGSSPLFSEHGVLVPNSTIPHDTRGCWGGQSVLGLVNLNLGCLFCADIIIVINVLLELNPDCHTLLELSAKIKIMTDLEILNCINLVNLRLKGVINLTLVAKLKDAEGHEVLTKGNSCSLLYISAYIDVHAGCLLSCLTSCGTSIDKCTPAKYSDVKKNVCPVCICTLLA